MFRIRASQTLDWGRFEDGLGVPVHEDLPDPCVHRKADVVEAEKADAVGYLLANAVVSEIVHGVFVGQGSKIGKIQPSAACVLAGPFDIFGPVAQLVASRSSREAVEKWFRRRKE